MKRTKKRKEKPVLKRTKSPNMYINKNVLEEKYEEIKSVYFDDGFVKDNSYDNYTIHQLEKILTPKMINFCHEYIRNGWNASKAARTVGYSENTAGTIAGENLRKPQIRRYIELVKNDLEKLCNISKAMQIQEYKKIAFSSLRKLHNSWIELKTWQELVANDPDALDAVESTEYKTYDTKWGTTEMIKIKLFSKTHAQERIDKLMGYQEPKELKVNQETTLNLGQGSVSAIREAFGLGGIKNPITK